MSDEGTPNVGKARGDVSGTVVAIKALTKHANRIYQVIFREHDFFSVQCPELVHYFLNHSGLALKLV